MASVSAGSRQGTDRAAILLLALGEQEASAVLKHMSPRDVQKVGAAMAALASVSRDDVSRVLEDFTEATESHTSLGVGTDDYLRKVLANALGEDRAAGVMDRILGGRSSRGLDAVKWMDPKAVSEMMRNEHPQIVAIVLAYLEPEHAAAILSQLPDNAKSDILMRIAVLDGVQPMALNELDGVMEKMFAGNANSKASVFGGPKVAANIINNLEASIETTVMEHIGSVDEALAAKLHDLIFTFGDLIDLDDRGLQELLREVQGDQLILALKGVDDILKEKFFKNMSQRAAEILKDDLESKGPVRLSDVEAAQKEMLIVVRRMAEAGTIMLGKGGGEFV
ncbi:MAG: flagellar motor switch protein FliG [Steroidobacteraceae bacterium]